MRKTFLLLITIFLLAGGIIVYVLRYDIFQYSAEKIIRQNLPDYIQAEKIICDLEKRRLEINGFRIKNPKLFGGYLAEIDSISCKYEAKGKHILDGIEITEIVVKEPEISIERLSKGQINVNEMGSVIDSKNSNLVKNVEQKSPKVLMKKPKVEDISLKEVWSKIFLKNRKISDFIKIPEIIKIKGGRIVFTDYGISMYGQKPYIINIEIIEGELGLTFNEDYGKVLFIRSCGKGFIAPDQSQKINWESSFDPTVEALTMSNKCNIENMNVILLKPYYDNYAPIDVKSGIFSGALVFNFDNGNIGSINVLKINELKFEIKEEWIGSEYWGTSISEIIKYLQSSTEEIIFDFKIKGSMNSPRFYPGPNVKKAIQCMVVDKISEAIKDEDDTVGKVMDIMKDIFR